MGFSFQNGTAFASSLLDLRAGLVIVADSRPLMLVLEGAQWVCAGLARLLTHRGQPPFF